MLDISRGRVAPWLILLVTFVSWSCRPSSPSSAPIPRTSTASQGSEAIASKVDVELDIFSGNPNPVWALADADRAQFLEKLATLPAASPAEFDTNLGYRGFIVHIMDATESSVVRIQHGKVHVLGAGKDLYYSDPKRGVERWLLRTGQPFLDSTIYGIVERELSS